MLFVGTGGTAARSAPSGVVDAKVDCSVLFNARAAMIGEFIAWIATTLTK
jgi:hypothetical protein